MKQTLLVIDVHYMCHRAFHSTPGLSWKARPTGIIFGFLKSISFLKDEFQTDRVVFCFEHPHLFRRDLYPAYKKKRIKKELTDEEKQSYSEFAIQISELRHRYLPQIGFKNVFSVKGMESDDVMAAIAQQAPDDQEVVLVTADHDLFQCLDDNVCIYSPQARKLLTQAWFKRTYGIRPKAWAKVKAIAGCSSDEVKGIKGIGEITALKYLRGELKPKSAAYKAISSHENHGLVRLNRKLVQLPFAGCPTIDILDDEISVEGWKSVCGLLGMKSLALHPPVATRKLTSISAKL